MTPQQAVVLAECIQDVRRARLALKHAKARLLTELPDEVESEIHYNQRHAQVPAEYAEAKKILTENDE